MKDKTDFDFLNEHHMCYLLDENKNPAPCTIAEWATFRDNRLNCQVAFNELGDIYISTVFLGLDQSCWDSRPIVFETMIFNKSGDDVWRDIYMDRYSTWDEALEGHQKAIEWVTSGANNGD